MSEKVGLNDFSPPTQDVIAIELMRKRHILERLLENNPAAAVLNAKNEWASMPKFRNGQWIPQWGGFGPGQAQHYYQQRLAAYQGQPPG